VKKLRYAARGCAPEFRVVKKSQSDDWLVWVAGAIQDLVLKEL
jgi:hypothetical protein